MCGRKTLIKSKESIVQELMLNEWSIKNYKPSYNIAPTHYSPVLLGNNERRIAKLMKWGLIPSWSKSDSFASKMINARSETIIEKYSYKNLISQNRCIIISNGYYEWKNNKPYYFYHQNNNLLLLAGLWTSWKKSSKEIKTYTIITTTAHSNIKHIHSRMPLIIDTPNIDQWLNQNDKKFKLNHYLESHHNQENIDYIHVTSYVNQINNNSKKCLIPSKEEKTIELFK
ncbi:MAG: SOS response-associated peptidase [Candidatus Neomarinimicrobiota bacterium]